MKVRARTCIRLTGRTPSCTNRRWAKSTPGHLLAASQTVQNSTETDRAHWTFGDTVTPRGRGEPTTLAPPV
jgi:class 3 adenylate cyclase